jgi:hypothetical protein
MSVESQSSQFPIDPLDRVMTLKEWRALRRISASTERRMRKAGVGPKLVYISPAQLGVRVRDDLRWIEHGGAAGAPAQSADPPTARRSTGRNTAAATAASVAARTQRKVASTATATAAPVPIADSSIQPGPTDSKGEGSHGVTTRESPSPVESAARLQRTEKSAITSSSV